MKQTINVYDFERAFQLADRRNNFSYAGLHALFDYLEDHEDSYGEEIELDVIALCCDFSEYKNAIDCMNDYCNDLLQELTILDEYMTEWNAWDELSGEEQEDTTEPEMPEDEIEEEALQWLYDRTQVIVFDTGVIVGAF